MITGTVSQEELTMKTLRAGDYLINPDKLAKDLVRTWLECTGLNKFLNPHSPQLHGLRTNIAHAVRIAYERGQKNATRTD